MTITKKRCIVQQGSGYLKITSKRSKRELRKRMEVMEHIKALGGLRKSVSNEVITYRTNTSEFPPIQVSTKGILGEHSSEIQDEALGRVD